MAKEDIKGKGKSSDGSEEILSRSKYSVICNLATIGHVDHGKTTLAASITFVLSKKGLAAAVAYSQIDNAPEEKARGITIKASHIKYQLDVNKVIAHIDCPGHADFVKNMIIGVSQAEYCILVVAATDGVMPQTREHILLAKQSGVKHMILFINKIDAVDDEDIIDLVEEEVLDLLKEYEFTNVPVFRGSALLAGEGNEQYMNIIYDMMMCIKDLPNPERNIDASFMMPIGGVNQIEGRGTVATGRIERGSVRLGDKVAVLTKKGLVRSTVTGIKIFKQHLDEAQAGDNVGLLLRGVERDQIDSGSIVFPDTAKDIQVSKKFKCIWYMRKSEEGGRNNVIVTGYSPQFFMLSANITGDITLPDDVAVIAPGDDVQNVIVELMYPWYLEVGMRFSARESNRTVANGIITEILQDSPRA